ncbi:zinc-binding dehydrogenase [Streptomyces javensis]|uniref:zinc-binding dehydrogenase n=1 Tax=Streptomyces javensis TaxID=114698 RepID=UPI0033DD35BF
MLVHRAAGGVGHRLGIRQALTIVSPSAPDLAQLSALVATGWLSVHVDQVLPLAEAAKAHEIVARGAVTGKLVLVP